MNIKRWVRCFVVAMVGLPAISGCVAKAPESRIAAPQVDDAGGPLEVPRSGTVSVADDCNEKHNAAACLTLAESLLVDAHSNPVGAVSLLEMACGRGSGRACFLLGGQFYWGTVVAEDASRAADLFTKSCSLGYSQGCGRLAMANFDSERCDAGFPVGCYKLALAYREATGVTRDVEKCLALLKKACEGGYAPACHTLGYMYVAGLNVRRDPKAAVPWLERACEGNHADGCSQLAELVSRGTGLPRDKLRATDLYSKAAAIYETDCNHGVGFACNNLAIQYAEGHGVPRSSRRAIELFRKACKAGDQLGCDNMASSQ